MQRRAGEIEAASRAALCESKTTFLEVLTDNKMLLALDDWCPMRTGSRRKACRSGSTLVLSGSSTAEQVGATTARSPPTRSGSRRARRSKAQSGRFKLPFPTTRNLIRLGKQRASRPRSTTQGQAGRHRDARVTKLNGGRQLVSRSRLATMATCLRSRGLTRRRLLGEKRVDERLILVVDPAFQSNSSRTE